MELKMSKMKCHHWCIWPMKLRRLCGQHEGINFFFSPKLDESRFAIKTQKNQMGNHPLRSRATIYINFSYSPFPGRTIVNSIIL